MRSVNSGGEFVMAGHSPGTRTVEVGAERCALSMACERGARSGGTLMVESSGRVNSRRVKESGHGRSFIQAADWP